MSEVLPAEQNWKDTYSIFKLLQHKQKYKNAKEEVREQFHLG